jgi:multidrug efflux pump subunit AcrA (membrane-fusion protein)
MARLAALWAVPPLALGGIVAFWMISGATGPVQHATPPAGLAVRVAPVTEQVITPAAHGWGNVRAAESWSAVAEVRGQVIWRHADLEPGKMIAAGTRLLEIDPGDYELAITQAEADLAAFAAEASQIDAETANTDRILALEEARLALSESDLARVRELVAQGSAPQSRADEAERATLLARRTVVELQNTLALIPSRRERLAAQQARTEAALARARRDLAHTVVVAPFDLRLTSVQIERFQVVATGQPLLAGDGIARAEVVLQVPTATFSRLIQGLAPDGDILAAMRDNPSTVIAAEVRQFSDLSQVWHGTVTRIDGGLDPRARTVPVVVSVDDPYAGAAPPLRLPLVPNMQVAITLTGAPQPAQVVIPEAALHGTLVYLADTDDRLELRPVTPLFRQDGLAVIGTGLEPGERLILDDITPALPGLRLTPVEIPAEAAP